MPRRKTKPKEQSLGVVGWREWVRLPKLGLPRVKVKVDSGARTSALHAENIVYFRQGRRKMVRFRVYPHQNDRNGALTREAPLLEKRSIRSSGGHVTLRPVVATAIELHGEVWRIELTLVDREIMGFRMLLGRQAIRHRFVIDAARSYVAGKERARVKKKGS